MRSNGGGFCTAAILAAALVMTSWRSEMQPLPDIALVGRQRVGKMTMIQLFQMLCRHSIFASDLTSSAFHELHGRTIPTVLFDEAITSGEQRTRLDLSGSTPESEALLKALYRCPKVFAFTDLPRHWNPRRPCIVISMHETGRANLHRVTEPSIQLEAENLRAKLLQFRLERFDSHLCSKSISRRPYSFNLDLYESLARSVTDDDRVRDGLVSIMLQQQLQC